MSNAWKRAAFALMLVLGLTLGGAVNAQMGGEEPKKEEPKAEEGKKLELPWTMDEVKKAWKDGATWKFSFVTKTGAEEQFLYMIMKISDVNEKGYKQSTTVTDKDGKELAPANEKTETWEEWGNDFKFTDKDTKVSDEKVKVGAGEFDCKVYTQSKEKDGVKTVTAFYFAKDKAGMVIKVAEEEANKDQKVPRTMELQEVK